MFLSLSVYLMSTYFVIDLIIYTFDWILLLVSIVGFVFAHYLWPPKCDNESVWYDLLEIVIELPFRAMALFIRGLAKLFKHGDSGIDF